MCKVFLVIFANVCGVFVSYAEVRGLDNFWAAADLEGWQDALAARFFVRVRAME